MGKIKMVRKYTTNFSVRYIVEYASGRYRQFWEGLLPKTVQAAISEGLYEEYDFTE